MKHALIACDGARAPANVRSRDWDVRETISHRGDAANLNIHISAPAVTFRQLTGRASDLLKIAAYAFASDQEVRRGGLANPYDDDWRRSFTLCLPVIDVDFWSDSSIRSLLTDALAFVSDDQWAFHFVEERAVEGGQIALDIDASQTFGDPDLVCLFSGGLDSLCSVVEQYAVRKRRPVLIGHSPAFHVGTRQAALKRDLARRFQNRWPFPYISGAVHRWKSDAPESTQRTRSFLYATLGTVVAHELGLREVHLSDNGIVSLNLPISGQLNGAMATRSTHPKFIRMYNRLVAAVFPNGPQVSNPLWDRTRAEVLRILKRATATGLIGNTVSCAHTRFKTRSQPHCGVCSQCIDRRFATIDAGLENDDAAEGYEVDVFNQEIREGTARSMAYSYYRFGKEVAETDDDTLFERFPQLFDCVDPRDPKQLITARAFTAMFRRHGECVVRVMDRQIARSTKALASQRLPESCLLVMVAGKTAESTLAVREQAAIGFTPDYRVAKIGTTSFPLTVNQSRVVQLLAEHPLGRTGGLGQAYMLEKLEIRSKTLFQVFRGSSAWGKVVVPAPGRGVFRLGP